MLGHRFFLFTIVFFVTLTAYRVTSRAVNISNTWTLPEDNFPVFYRYFRDSISWFEADAVCQFHHGNLVTADSSSQYDAIRAYLKELDITENVWIGLSRATEKPNFVWSSSGISLSNDGHWREPIPAANEALCVTMDPTGDFLWRPLPCGGPQVASFICELPVPSWALGLRGCLLTELPSLTVLYIPEQMALELTSDCGFEGTKRITCRGNADRETLLKQLSCDDFEEKSSGKTTSIQPDVSDESSFSFKPTKPWTLNTIEVDYVPTRHRRETENTLIPSSPTPTVGSDKYDPSRKEDVTEPLTDFASTISDSHLAEMTSDSNDDMLTRVHEAVTTSSYVLKQEESNTARRSNYEAATSTTDPSRRPSEAPLQEDIAEYPSAINQGQLFSIIENGTMFDIIELNETGVDESKSTKKEILNFSQTTEKYTATINNVQNVSNSTETTNELKFVDKLRKKTGGKSKIEYYKKSDPKKDNFPSEKEARKIKEKLSDVKSRNLSKEFEMYPIVAGSDIKLNRTHRKEVPDSKFENHHVKIQLAERNNVSESFIVSTKRQRKLNETDPVENASIESTTNSVINLQITSLPTEEKNSLTSSVKVDLNESKTEVNDETSTNPTDKEQILEKSLLGEIGLESNENSTLYDKDEDFLQSEPFVQNRPNRKRKLNNNKRRSYYPYFFSRVLG